MAFSPENKPFKNSVFLQQCVLGGGGGRKMRALSFSLGNYSCKKKEMGVRWNGGSFKMRQKGWPWTPQRLLSSLPGPQDLRVKIRYLRSYVRASNLCLGSQAGGGGREKNQPDSLLWSEPFILKWDERLLKDVNGNLCKHKLKVSSIQRVTQP